MSEFDLVHALQRLGDGEAAMDFAAHRELMDPEFRDFRFGAMDPVIGVDPYIQAFREFRAAFDDYTVDVPIPPVARAPHAVTTWVLHARMTGSFIGLEPSGAAISWPGCSVWTFDAQGHICELRTFADTGQLLAQAQRR